MARSTGFSPAEADVTLRGQHEDALAAGLLKLARSGSAAVDDEPWWCRNVIYTFHYVM